MASGRDGSEDLHLSYLEALDEEYWALLGGEAQPNPLKDAYARARVEFDATPEHPPEARRQAQDRLEHAEGEFRRELHARLHEAKRSALCFSGGGIRSATFGLGVLQGLAAHSAREDDRSRLLGEIDYLSTVSGGGYLGSWFSAWAARDTGQPAGGSAGVIRQLAENPETGFDPEPPAVRHLRAYSNYLIPRVGLFSGDTWAVLGTVVRNMFLNWLVLLPLLGSALLVPVAAHASIMEGAPALVMWAALAFGFACGVVATAYVGYDLPSAGNARGDYAYFLALCLVPFILAAILLNTFWAWLPDDGSAAAAAGAAPAAAWDLLRLGRSGVTSWHLAMLGALMHAGGMLLGIVAAMARFRRPAPKTGIVSTAAAVVTGGLGGLVMSGVIRSLASVGVTSVNYVIIAFPVVIGVFLLAGALLVGLTSYITEDKDREWWARCGGMLLAVALGWLALSSVVLYSEWIIERLTWQASGSLGLLTGWATARLGSSTATKSGRRGDEGSSKASTANQAKSLGARLALPAFLFILVVVVSRANTWLLGIVDARIGSGDGVSVAACIVLASLYVLTGLVASYFINVNSFSLHAMYRLRLVRAYLGASNPRRAQHAHRFTGFHEEDDVPMRSLSASKPLHVVNMALNLVGGRNLAWQQRKAESFTATRLHTGSCRVGFRPSSEYAAGRVQKWRHNRPFSLGTAMTISGAAASPNMGYHSSPLLTIVMTLFNARLGWWLGNPAAKGGYWRLPGPFGVRPFLDEAFGMTDDRNRWVYLSDGGHFDNLGLYEMVIRRCHTIVVCDAGADEAFSFEDVGNAVRKVRVDLGVSIEFETPMPREFDARSRAPGCHCAIGRIRYSAADGERCPDGVLIYIKASLTGDEPADVLHYAAQNRAFPHQSTTDQFFDEAQFESYRRLGLHIVERICEGNGKVAPPSRQIDLAEFVRRTRDYCADGA